MLINIVIVGLTNPIIQVRIEWLVNILILIEFF